MASNKNIEILNIFWDVDILIIYMQNTLWKKPDFIMTFEQY